MPIFHCDNLDESVLDKEFLELLEKRMEHFDINNTIPADLVYQQFGVDIIDGSGCDEIEFE